jgi:cytochrome b6-f complex iron-sulfur subunit
MTDFSRRSLIRNAALVPLVAKVACVRRIPANRSITVAPAVDGDVVVPLAQAPELSAAGGAVIARPAGSAGGFLVAFTGTGYVALRAECPHEGCDVAWVPEDREVECPCHGSRFAGDGTVLNPPAVSDLNSFPAQLDGQGNVVVHQFAGDGTFAERVRDGQLTLPLSEFPALANVGGIVLGRPEGFPGPLLLTRLAGGAGPDAVAAISAVCTHLACTVLPGAGALQCPCHDSRFDLTGKFLQGPAAGASLARFGVAFDGTTLVVSTTPRA